MATVGLGMLIAVAVTSIRAARRRLSYETWYGIHLYAYLGIALAFLHELVVGTDFVDDPMAVAYWVGLYVVAIGLLLTFRVLQPIVFSVRHRLRVERVVQEAPGVVSVHLTGRAHGPAPHPGRSVLPVPVPVRWRLVAAPSVSPSRRLPTASSLRLTVKDLGDDSRSRRDACSRAPGCSPRGHMAPSRGSGCGSAEGAVHRRRHRHHAAARDDRGAQPAGSGT